MKEKGIFIGIGVTAVVAIIIAFYLYWEHQKDKEKIKELEEDKLKLILDSIKRNPDLSEEIKRQLLKLIEKFQSIDEKISNELAQALQLFQIGQVENAIEDLVKIIEHLLTVHYDNDDSYKKWLKSQKDTRDTLHNKLSFCKYEQKINEIEHGFLVVL